MTVAPLESAIPIPSLLPRGKGHQFVVYGDSCSGILGTLHERNFAAINSVVRRLAPPPEYILFLGDEIAGLTADQHQLRAQWRYWLDHEMGWLDRAAIPLWHITGNHTVYDPMSEAVFAKILGYLPRNGPPGQEGLSYWVRRDDLLLVFVNTLWSGLGGEGYVETEWLQEMLHRNSDAVHKLVVGHHPIHPINGFSGAYQREVGPECANKFWDVLVEGGVLAYLCSHILAFDAQVHRGVPQVCTAGAGTAHRMPEDIEYLHCVQAALDAEGLRYRVLDIDGHVREQLSWPTVLPPAEQWNPLPTGECGATITRPSQERIVAFHFAGRAAPEGTSAVQTLLSAFDPDAQPRLWIGLRGLEQRLTVTIGPEDRRSPHYWYGPSFAPGKAFDLQLLIHTGMGPGVVMFRLGADDRWSSLAAASPWGAERLTWPERWSVGHGHGGPHDRPFLGLDLAASVTIGAQSVWSTNSQ